MWQQVYDPLGNSVLSTIAAAIPVVTLLALIATGKMKAHWGAIIALPVALAIASCRYWSFLFTIMSIRVVTISN